MKYVLAVFVLMVAFLSCDKEDDNIIDDSVVSTSYFPPVDSEEWESISPSELNWNTDELENLLNYLASNHTRAFIVLKNGKIVIEEYFGYEILGTSDFDRNSQWYWASAGKTLTATLVGIAQQEGQLNIQDATSDYLGDGWTSLPPEKEQLIRVQNQLTMTTGLEYNIDNLDCTLPTCLQYKTDPGQQWYYHNAPYTLLRNVVENATETDYNDYTQQKIGAAIGMNGQWLLNGENNVYWSTARDMARFGLLMLNKGNWDNREILTDENYYHQMINTSQTLNPSYGYLWWLNGKTSIIFPSIPTSFNMPLSESAPDDLFAGMGKNGQFVEVIPSKDLVVVRMGEAPDDSLVSITFHDEMWEKMNVLMNE